MGVHHLPTGSQTPPDMVPKWSIWGLHLGSQPLDPSGVCWPVGLVVGCGTPCCALVLRAHSTLGATVHRPLSSW